MSVKTIAHQNLAFLTQLFICVRSYFQYVFVILFCMFVFLGNHTYIGEISLRWIFNITHGVSIVPANEFEVITEFLKTQV